MNPLEVYTKLITLHVNKSSIPLFTTRLLCYCDNGVQPNCFTNNIEPIYPGQHILLHFALNPEIMSSSTEVPISIKLYVQNSDYSICQVSSMFEAEQPVLQNCTEVNYNILSENNSLCMLVLYNNKYRYSTMYYVKVLKCPAGFSFDVIKKSCQCDEIL